MSTEPEPSDANEWVVKMKAARSGNEEGGHAAVDGVLCDLAKSLGYRRVVTEWKRQRKWYA